ncbi:MAG: SRPBCC domain-containing protein [Steroidobacteraceae bacterium]|nr:SRPBCC domain-containing protein [Steroidobacteraceae bacterium]
MAVKTDGSKRWVEMDVILQAAPEQVWKAVATGAGYTAWFTRTTLDERVGGKIEFHMGPGATSVGEIVEWQPPAKLSYVERGWMEGAPDCATDITLTSRSGGRTLFRMTHSLATSKEDWDEALESFESGWQGFFEVLRLYLAHHAGKNAAMVQSMVQTKSDMPTVWRKLTTSLALESALVGERVNLSKPDPLTAVVARVWQDSKLCAMTLHLEAPAGVAIVGAFSWGGQTMASVTGYFYGADADKIAAASEPRWNAWLQETSGASRSG